MMVLADPDPRRIARVLTTWFGSADPADRSVRPQPRWFAKDPAFDRALRDTFGEDVDAARRGLLDRWQHTPAGLLALCILIDQWSRNLHRGSPASWSADPYMRAVVNRALNEGRDAEIGPVQRAFVYMPLMHSEELADHERSLVRFGALQAELRELGVGADYLRYAHLHRDIIVRFGRYPHRNAVLGRATTPDEAAFLLGPDSSF
jgi:uncharacterized protein (DUF924 family)